MLLHPNDHILFYGDSITDAGRNRETAAGDPDGWGGGYAQMVAAFLSARYPELQLQFTNRGISGNRIYDLEDRLEEDVISLRPQFVSILIGINDVWRRYDNNMISEIGEFKESYRRVLERLTAAGIEVLLLEPFVLPVPEDRATWREDLDPKIEAVRELAQEFSLKVLPFDAMFAEAAAKREAAFWLPDGVHPSSSGHALMAQAWMEAVEA